MVSVEWALAARCARTRRVLSRMSWEIAGYKNSVDPPAHGCYHCSELILPRTERENSL